MDIGMSTASYKDLKSNGIVHIGISHVGQPKTVLPSLYLLLLDELHTDCCDQRGKLSRKTHGKARRGLHCCCRIVRDSNGYRDGKTVLVCPTWEIPICTIPLLFRSL